MLSVQRVWINVCMSLGDLTEDTGTGAKEILRKILRCCEFENSCMSNQIYDLLLPYVVLRFAFRISVLILDLQKAHAKDNICR